jgi:hypothetical protein
MKAAPAPGERYRADVILGRQRRRIDRGGELGGLREQG